MHDDVFAGSAGIWTVYSLVVMYSPVVPELWISDPHPAPCGWMTRVLGEMAADCSLLAHLHARGRRSLSSPRTAGIPGRGPPGGGLDLPPRAGPTRSMHCWLLPSHPSRSPTPPPTSSACIASSYSLGPVVRCLKWHKRGYIYDMYDALRMRPCIRFKTPTPWPPAQQGHRGAGGHPRCGRSSSLCPPPPPKLCARPAAPSSPPKVQAVRRT